MVTKLHHKGWFDCRKSTIEKKEKNTRSSSVGNLVGQPMILIHLVVFSLFFGKITQELLFNTFFKQAKSISLENLRQLPQIPFFDGIITLFSKISFQFLGNFSVFS